MTYFNPETDKLKATPKVDFKEKLKQACAQGSDHIMRISAEHYKSRFEQIPKYKALYDALVTKTPASDHLGEIISEMSILIDEIKKSSQDIDNVIEETKLGPVDKVRHPYPCGR